MTTGLAVHLLRVTTAAALLMATGASGSVVAQVWKAEAAPFGDMPEGVTDQRVEVTLTQRHSLLILNRKDAIVTVFDRDQSSVCENVHTPRGLPDGSIVSHS